jgi:hypothetical protein
LLGCLAALPLLAILLWRGMPALNLAIASLSIGALAGLLYGGMTRPTTMAAAMEADRQLEWADLLSSAMSVIERSREDPWAQVVAQIADACCRTTSPSTVVLNRLGARAWGGIGLASALVIVLGLLPTYAAPTHAGDSRASANNPLAAMENLNQKSHSGTQSFARRTATEQDPDDPRASHMGESDSQTKPPSGDANLPANDDRHRPNDTTDPNDAGSGASHSIAPTSTGLNRAQNGTHSMLASRAGKTSGGVGTSSTPRSTGEHATGEAAGTNQAGSKSSAPWQSADWASHSQKAMDALETGRIPDAYRDVVRGYFERP